MADEAHAGNRRRVIVLVLIALVALCFCGVLVIAALPTDGRLNAVTGVTSGATDGAGVTASPSPAPAVGDAVALGSATWTVLEAQRLGAEFYGDRPEGEPLTTAGGWVRVLALVGNGGAEPFTVPDMALADADGREFGRSLDAIWRIPSERLCSLDQVNPGIERECEYVFEVPLDAAGLRALVSEPGPFAQRAAIDLGLP